MLCFRNFLLPVLFCLFTGILFSQRLIPYRKGKLWGYADSNGVIKIEPRYSYVDQPYCDDLARVKLNDKWGVLNIEKDSLVVPAIHHYVNVHCGDWMGGTIIVHTGEVDQILDHSGKLIATVAQVEPYTRGPNLLVRQGGKLGLITNTGKWRMKPHYDWIEVCEDGYYILKSGGETQYYDPSGKLIFKKNLVMHAKFENGYARIRYKVRNKGDSASLAKQKLYITEYHGRVDGSSYAVQRELTLEEKLYFDQENLIDHKGNLLVPEGYSTSDAYAMGGFIVVRGPKGMGIIDSTGKFVVPAVYDDIDVSRGFIRLQKNKQQGFVTPGPWRVAEPAYDYVIRFSGRLYIVRVGEKYRLVDPEGKQLYGDFDWIDDHDNTGFTARRNDRLYWIDENGKMILDRDTSKYSSAFPFDGELSIVYHRQRAGLINRQGKEIAPPVFAAFYREGPGLYRAHGSGRASYSHDAGIMNADGKLIIDTIHHMAHVSRNYKHLLVEDNKLWGLYGLQGRQLMAQEYTEISPIANGYYVADKPNPDYKPVPVAVTENGEEVVEESQRSKVPSVLICLVGEDGHILRTLPGSPGMNDNFIFLQHTNGWMRFDGKEFWED